MRGCGNSMRLMEAAGRFCRCMDAGQEKARASAMSWRVRCRLAVVSAALLARSAWLRSCCARARGSLLPSSARRSSSAARAARRCTCVVAPAPFSGLRTMHGSEVPLAAAEKTVGAEKRTGILHLQVGLPQRLLQLLIPPLVLCHQGHHCIPLFRPAYTHSPLYNLQNRCCNCNRRILILNAHAVHKRVGPSGGWTIGGTHVSCSSARSSRSRIFALNCAISPCMRASRVRLSPAGVSGELTELIDCLTSSCNCLIDESSAASSLFSGITAMLC